jgi:hypothetical protein
MADIKEIVPYKELRKKFCVPLASEFWFSLLSFVIGNMEKLKAD